MYVKKPDWLRVRHDGATVERMNRLMSKLSLNTVCREANCPNMGECFKKNTATFMILGSNCTRHCRFCNVTKEGALAPDPREPQNVAEAAGQLGLSHIVVTSVTRDDLPDGGAAHFAKTIEALRQKLPKATVEVLIPDLKGHEASLDSVINARPDVIGHNVETVPSLYGRVRPEAQYRRSLEVLRYVKKTAPDIITKTGIMVGLGETPEEVGQVMDDLVEVGCDILTVGQYLRPTLSHIEVAEYVTPGQFDEYKALGEEKGIRFVASSPLVRSSYNALEALKEIRKEKV